MKKDNDMNNEIGIRFGMLSGSFSKQLSDQGFRYSQKTVTELQKDLQAIHRLSLKNILSEKAEKAAYNKLFTKIKAHIKSMNKTKP